MPEAPAYAFFDSVLALQTGQQLFVPATLALKTHD